MFQSELLLQRGLLLRQREGRTPDTLKPCGCEAANWGEESAGGCRPFRRRITGQKRDGWGGRVQQAAVNAGGRVESLVGVAVLRCCRWALKSVLGYYVSNAHCTQMDVSDVTPWFCSKLFQGVGIVFQSVVKPEDVWCLDVLVASWRWAVIGALIAA